MRNIYVLLMTLLVLSGTGMQEKRSSANLRNVIEINRVFFLSYD